MRRAKDVASAQNGAARPLPSVAPHGGLSGKLAEVTARRLEDEIIRRGWPVGEIVGSETELLQRLGVSRAVFREAVRLVEHHFVATMRRGPSGGLTITAPSTSAVSRAVELNLIYHQASAADVFEARAAIELKCVELAVERIDEEGVTRLREALAREMDRQDHDHLLGTHEIHQVIAEITGNSALALFLEVLTRATERVSNVDFRAPVPHRQSLIIRQAHGGLVDAIVAKDGSLARHRMLAHLDAMAVYATSRS